MNDLCINADRGRAMDIVDMLYREPSIAVYRITGGMVCAHHKDPAAWWPPDGMSQERKAHVESWREGWWAVGLHEGGCLWGASTLADALTLALAAEAPFSS